MPRALSLLHQRHRILGLGLAAGLALSSRASGQVAAQSTSFPLRPFAVSSAPFEYFRAGERLAFFARHPRAGIELWGTDGTAAGTELLTNACEGDCLDPEFRTALRRVETRDLAFLSLPPSSSECAVTRLWRTDGTPSGTFPLTGCEGPGPSALVASGGRAYFVLEQSRRAELWASDGSEAGTERVYDFGPRQGAIQGLAVLHGQVFLLVDIFGHEPELWASDGSPAGTRLVARLGALDLGGDPLVATADRLFFRATGSDGLELFASDGTPAGTRAVSRFRNPQPFRLGRFLKVLGREVYWLAEETGQGTELWASDGTPAGTRPITHFRNRQPFEPGFGADDLATTGNRVLFPASESRQMPGDPLDLWRAEGRAEPAAQLAPLCPPPGDCPRGKLVGFGDRVYFLNFDAEHGVELWSSNGSPERTGRLTDLCPGPCSGLFQSPVVAGELYFAAYWQAQGAHWLFQVATPGARPEPIAALAAEERLLEYRDVELGRLDSRVVFTAWDPEHGAEPHLFEPGGGPETLLADLARGGASDSLDHLTPLGSRLVFRRVRTDSEGEELWAASGPQQLERLLPDLRLGQCLAGLLCAIWADGGQAYFLQRSDGDSRGGNLFLTDGTAAGTRTLTAFPPDGSGPVVTRVLGFLGGALRFQVATGEPGGLELWESNGTPAGTHRISSWPLEPGLKLVAVTALGDEVYFVAEDPSLGTQVWKADPSFVAAERLTDLSAASERARFVRVGSRVLFSGRGSQGELQLWASDGTPGGTQVLASLGTSDDPFDALAQRFLVTGGRLYFFSRPSSPEGGLWVSDGTPGGTHRLRAFSRWAGDLAFFTVFAPGPAGFYFNADDGEHGFELWASDGTAEGTRLVKDVLPGPFGSYPIGLATAQGSLYFLANDGVHGTELWRSDGTAATTRLVHDLNPGPAGSFYSNFVEAAGRLYFLAQPDGAAAQLWSLPLAPTDPLCADSPLGLCASADRFRIEVAWRDFEGRSGFGQPVPLTPDTGAFWFFDPANLELVTKILDGRALNDHFWTFYGALSSVEYDLTVTDTETGLTRRYSNPGGQLASVADTRAFGPGGTSLESYIAPALGPEVSSQAKPTGCAKGAPRRRQDGLETPGGRYPGRATTGGSCEPAPTRLCLAGGRFALEASWKDFAGRRGSGQALALTSDTGAFWFFDSANLELVAKVIDGQAVNSHFWLFYGALSSVEYTLTLTDTLTGQRRMYLNPAGNLASVADTAAF